MNLNIMNKTSVYRERLNHLWQKTNLLKAAELYFFVLPTVFIISQFILSRIMSSSFLEFLFGHPMQTLQFISYVSCYFVALILKMIEQVKGNPNSESVIKIVMLIVLCCQLLNYHLLNAAVLMLLIRKVYGWSIFKINFRLVFNNKHIILLPTAYLTIVSILLFVVKIKM